VKRAAKAKDVIRSLKAAGFAISLDDFGSGFTSLRHVLDFPLDTVKLDRELVGRVVKGGQLGELKAIVELCHLQNYAVVAEGVENNQMFAALSAIGCDLFQGFGIQRPASLADLQSGASAEIA
jgi:EAL domain-containing protein (putative c-di-GMP-specific phosphodiesterase class I)